jgi:nitrite reductase/ring-hydroxylating ferredoxin subunit
MDVGDRIAGAIIMIEQGGQPTPGTYLCALEDIPDGGAHEVVMDIAGESTRLVVLRRGSMVAAYLNRCPHFRIPLNSTPGQFLVSGGELWCAHHSATFRFEDGVCTDGPCRGGALDAVQIVKNNNGVFSTDACAAALSVDEG